MKSTQFVVCLLLLASIKAAQEVSLQEKQTLTASVGEFCHIEMPNSHGFGCFLTNNSLVMYTEVAGDYVAGTAVDVAISQTETISAVTVNPADDKKWVIVAGGKMYTLTVDPMSTVFQFSTNTDYVKAIFVMDYLVAAGGNRLEKWADVFTNPSSTILVSEKANFLAVGTRVLATVHQNYIKTWYRGGIDLKVCSTNVITGQSLTKINNIEVSQDDQVIMINYNNIIFHSHSTNDGCNFIVKSFITSYNQAISTKIVGSNVYALAKNNLIELFRLNGSQHFGRSSMTSITLNISSMIIDKSSLVTVSKESGKITIYKIKVNCTNLGYPTNGIATVDAYTCSCPEPLFESTITGCWFKDCTTIPYAFNSPEYGQCGCIFGSRWNDTSRKCEVDCGMIDHALGRSSAAQDKCICAPNYVWRQSDLTCIDCTDSSNPGCSETSFCKDILLTIPPTMNLEECLCLYDYGYKWVSSGCRNCSEMASVSLSALDAEWKCECRNSTSLKWVGDGCFDCSTLDSGDPSTFNESACACAQNRSFEWSYGRCTNCSGITTSSTISTAYQCGCLAHLGYRWTLGSCLNCEGVNVNSVNTITSEAKCKCLQGEGYFWNVTICQSTSCPIALHDWYLASTQNQCQCLSEASIVWDGQRCTYSRCAGFALTAEQVTTFDDCICLYPQGYVWIRKLAKCLLCRQFGLRNPLTYQLEERCKCLADELGDYSWKVDTCVPCAGVDASSALLLKDISQCRCLAVQGFQWIENQCFKCTLLTADDAPNLHGQEACQCIAQLKFKWMVDASVCYDCRSVSATNSAQITKKEDCACLETDLYKWDGYMCYICSKVTDAMASTIKSAEACACLFGTNPTPRYVWEDDKCVLCSTVFAQGYANANSYEACLCFDQTTHYWSTKQCRVYDHTPLFCQTIIQTMVPDIIDQTTCNCLSDYTFFTSRCIPEVCYNLYYGNGLLYQKYNANQKCGCYRLNYNYFSTSQNTVATLDPYLTTCSFCDGMTIEAATTQANCDCLRMYQYRWSTNKCVYCKGYTTASASTIDQDHCVCLADDGYVWNAGTCQVLQNIPPAQIDNPVACAGLSGYVYEGGKCIPSYCSGISTSSSITTEQVCGCISDSGYIWKDSKCQQCRDITESSVLDTEAKCTCLASDDYRFIDGTCIDCTAYFANPTSASTQAQCKCNQASGYKFEATRCLPCQGVSSSSDATTSDKCLCLRSSGYLWSYTNCSTDHCAGVVPEYAGIISTQQECTCLSGWGYEWNQSSTSCYLPAVCLTVQPENADTLAEAECRCLGHINYAWSQSKCQIKNNCDGIEPESVITTKAQCDCLGYIQFAWDETKIPKCYLNNSCKGIDKTQAASLTQANCYCLSYFGYKWSTSKGCYKPEPCQGVEPDKADQITNETTCYCLRYLDFEWNSTSSKCKLNTHCKEVDMNMAPADIQNLGSLYCSCFSWLDYGWVSSRSKCLLNDPCRGIEPANANTITNNDTCQCLSYLGYDWDNTYSICTFTQLCTMIQETDAVNVSTVEGCDCLRKHGYAWKPAGKVCVKCPTTTVVAATADRFTCYCLSGYIWDGASCIQTIQASLPARSAPCEPYFYWNTTRDSCMLDCDILLPSDNILMADGVCSCREGTEWNEKAVTCTDIPIAASVETNSPQVGVGILVIVIVVALLLVTLAFIVGKRLAPRLAEQPQQQQRPPVLMTESHEIVRNPENPLASSSASIRPVE